jgi:hypothetical protein
MFHPKKTASVVLVAALALSPLSLTIQPLGADAAFAGNGKGGGNGGGGSGGGGGGNGNGNRGGDKAERSGGAKGGETAANAGNARSSKPARASAPAAAEEGEITLAARDLGSMNGALNANINAVLAHVRNGNVNGPVGALAGLVAADAALGDLDADDVLARAAAWESYDAALAAALGDFPSVEDYVAAREADAAYPGLKAAWDEQNALYQEALATADPEAEALNPGPEPVDPDFVANAELDVLLDSPPAGDAPSEEDLAAANGVTDAELAVLEQWNKNPDAAPEITPEEQALLDSLRARFSDADLAAIAEAAGS